MSSRIAVLRDAACSLQHGRCHYCGVLMCCRDFASFAKSYGVTIRQARSIECTAEHLIPASEGGKNTRSNIVAACRFCNSRRHKKRKIIPSAAKYFQLVRKRVARKKWHARWAQKLIA
jgi:5-methylcytosine-specific restriction endonuclease McrA